MAGRRGDSYTLYPRAIASSEHNKPTYVARERGGGRNIIHPRIYSKGGRYAIHPHGYN